MTIGEKFSRLGADRLTFRSPREGSEGTTRRSLGPFESAPVCRGGLLLCPQLIQTGAGMGVTYEATRGDEDLPQTRLKTDNTQGRNIIALPPVTDWRRNSGLHSLASASNRSTE